jgi:hypothetical protein
LIADRDKALATLSKFDASDPKIAFNQEYQDAITAFTVAESELNRITAGYYKQIQDLRAEQGALYDEMIKAQNRFATQITQTPKTPQNTGGSGVKGKGTSDTDLWKQLDEEIQEYQAWLDSPRDQYFSDEEDRIIYVGELYAEYLQDRRSADETYLDWKKRYNKRLAEQEEKDRKEREKKEKKEAEERAKLLKKLADDTKKGLESANKVAEENLKKRVELMKAITESMANYWDKMADKNIESLDKQIEATKNRQDQLREITKQGTLDQSESLAFEQRKQAELERKRAKEERSKQRRQLVITTLQTYSDKVAKKEENPLQSTIRDVTVLKAFIDNLPLFYEGTDKDVKTSLGSPDLPGRDGYIIRVDGSEKIFNGDQSKKIGTVDNDTVANLSYLYRTNNLKIPVESAGASQARELVSELRDLKKIIYNKPEYLGSDLDVVGDMIISTIKKGNRIEKNHRKGGKSVW